MKKMMLISVSSLSVCFVANAAELSSSLESEQFAQHPSTVLTPTGEQAAEAFQEGHPEFFLNGGVNFASKRTCYSLLYNDDPVFMPFGRIGYSYFSFEFNSIFDFTKYGAKHGGYGNRKWKYAEVTFGPTITVPVQSVELSLNYTYRYHHRNASNYTYRDAQYIYAGIALPKMFLNPRLIFEIEVANGMTGATYAWLTIDHSFCLIEDKLSLNLSALTGFGTQERNGADVAFNAPAFRDIAATAALEWKLTRNLSFSPYITASQQLHGRVREGARDCYDTDNSALLVFGAVLSAKF